MTNALTVTQPATNAVTTQRTSNVGDYALVDRGTTDAQLVYLWLHSGKRAGSPATQETYSRVWRTFSAFVGVPMQDVTLSDLQAWQESLTGSAATVRTNVATIRSLFAFAQKTGYLRVNPAVMLAVPAVQKTAHRRALTQADTLRLFDACRTAQETALVRVLYSSGARISEILSLTWQDVQPRADGAGVLHIVRGKGGKSRQAGINKPAFDALAALRRPNATGKDFVFSTRNGTALDRVAAHRLLKTVATRAGLKDVTGADVSCHWLRHTHATQALAAGAVVTDVQAQLGHASLATTTGYAHSAAYSADKLL